MNTQTAFQTTTPPLRWDEAGGIRIGQSRVTLDSVLASYKNGFTPEEIAIQYPVLNLVEIYSVITYYLTYRQQFDDYLKERHQKAQERRQQLAQDNNLTNLRERLLSRHNNQLS